MEAELRSSFEGIDVELIDGKDGVFDVRLDGKLIFSRGCDPFGDRFPRRGEITELLRKEIG